MDKKLLLQHIELPQLLEILDVLPNTLLWIGNKDTQLLYANQAWLDEHGFQSLEEVIGLDDEALFPTKIAKTRKDENIKIMSGKALANNIDCRLGSDGSLLWFSSIQRPLLDRHKTIVGSYRITQYLDNTNQGTLAVEAIRIPTEFIAKHYSQDITIDTLSDVAGLSVSALERRFKRYLSKTPTQFLNEVRLINARRLLTETEHPIMQIGLQCGFSEHSYFSKQFKALFGILPSELRKSPQDSRI
ncbi:helix-turn-helix domain-containing protein [Glaciecola sp. SC05]|uniref:helix-turn-helix domain-containing protein n=1 Tax=Glaciecola sp. SC05 TaxID=1987355 RepID=UPI00352934A8